MNDDLISRQMAIDALEREKTYCTAYRDGFTPINVFEKYNVGLTDGIKALKNLPSTQQERVTLTEEEQRMYKKLRTFHNGSYARLLDKLFASAQSEIIRCKDCRWGREACGNIECFVDTNVPPEQHGYEWFCPNGERRANEIN